MSVWLQNQDDGTVIQLDASLKETVSGRSVVTKHPVETGAKIADHIRPELRQLRVDGVFVDEPIDALNDTRPAVPAGASRSVVLFMRLEEWRTAGAQLLVVTDSLFYTPFVITELSWPNDVKTGDTVNFSLGLEEVRFVETQTVAVRTSPRKLKKGGPKQPQPVRPAEMISGQEAGFESLEAGNGLAQAALDFGRALVTHRGPP